MPTAKELREKRAKLVADVRRDVIDKAEAEDRDLTADERSAVLKVLGGVAPDGTPVKGQVDELKGRIDRMEQLDALGSELAAGAGDRRPGRDDFDPRRPAPAPGADGAELAAAEHTRALALSAWLGSRRGLTQEGWEACLRCGINPLANELRIPLWSNSDYQRFGALWRNGHAAQGADRVADFRAALSNQVGPSGGYLVPPETLLRTLEINLLAFGGMRQVAESLMTSTGERISWPTVDDTSNKGVLLGVNTAAPTTGANPTFAKVFWDAYKFSSNSPDGTPVLVPYELIQDNVFSLPEVLGELLGVRLARVSNDYYTTGTGAAQPKGLVTAAATFSAGSATAIAFDDAFGLVHALDPAYRTPDCMFMSHDNTVLALRKLKDAVGKYLWEPGLQAGAPDRILGHGWMVNQSMDSSIASGKKSLLFGQLRKYKIRRVAGGLEGGLRLYRLQERYRDTDQDGFMAFMREDGNLLTAGTANVKVLTH